MKKVKFLKLVSVYTIVVLFSAIIVSFKSDSKIKQIDYYLNNYKKSSLLDIVKKELSNKRKPVLYFYATWCGPCKQFKKSLTDPLMIDALKDVTLIMIDADIDAKNEKKTKKYQVSAYPNYVIIDSTGKLLKQIDGGAWDENIPKNMAPVLKDFLNIKF